MNVLIHFWKVKWSQSFVLLIRMLYIFQIFQSNRNIILKIYLIKSYF